ncbi:hypothetical protein [Luteolibacter sp. Populi]|uniref:hypothetical protein n=1 Tax=Luteolibacter sp. Populi TaxID=3230487 RepID=UPI003466B5AB
MTLALHRSVSFWSGILVIGFVCWLWRDSQSHWSRVELFRVNATQSPSAMEFTYIPKGNTPRFARGQQAPNDIETEYFPAPFLRRGGNTLPTQAFWDEHAQLKTWRGIHWNISGIKSSGAWIAFIPHWLILLSVAVPWLGLLAWRAKRRKRQQAPG